MVLLVRLFSRFLVKGAVIAFYSWETVSTTTQIFCRFCVLRGNKKSRFRWEIRILLLFAFLLCGATEKKTYFYLQVIEYQYFLKAAQL